MLPLRLVLHPTDFSPHSEAAAKLAFGLARDYGAQVLVLHVMEPVAVGGAEGVVILDPAAYQADLRARLAEVRPPGPKVPVEHRLVPGQAAEEILRVAKESKCGVIVLGTHGRTGLGRLLVGSVAEQVVRKAPCPVLTVKAPPRDAAPVDARLLREQEPAAV
jgi:nucleotide-binding universal stress UspA family protein